MTQHWIYCLDDQQHIEDMITNLLRVLTHTGAITRDPTEGRPNRLYFERVLANLRGSNFHPGLASETIEADVIQLPALSETNGRDCVRSASWMSPRSYSLGELPT